MTDGTAARLSFLQTSARTLFLSSPSTSRHLLTQSTELAHSQNAHFRTNPEDACAACGSLLLPGWSTSISLAPERSKTRRGACSVEKHIHTKRLVRKCSTCDRITKGKVAYRPKHSKIKATTAAASQTAVEGIAVTKPASEKSNRTSSKKRAKARKDRQGLQALLDRSLQNKSSPRLDLMDLMQK